MSVGKIVLAGGHELRPGCEAMDERVLRAAGGAGARVVFLPTAVARHDPVGSGRGAVAYFRRLGAACDVAMILTRADADRPEMAALLERATLVYLGGGDPDILLAALQNSPAWDAVLRAQERGAIVGGSSAGAMAVCSHMLLPGRRDASGRPAVVGGLGLVSATLVLPHFMTSREAAALAFAADLSAGDPSFVVLGIPEQTALLGDGVHWEVAGPGSVAVVSAGAVRYHEAGQTLTLRSAAP